MFIIFFIKIKINIDKVVNDFLNLIVFFWLQIASVRKTIKAST
jgi:hypothetical protein